MAQFKFEDALARLETIVGQLEKGDLPLEESLKIFEEGVRLSKNCLKTLEEAERKVEILLKDKDGRKRPKPFAMGTEAREDLHEDVRDTEDQD
ncbi:MAG TPA: exodeoxyribonuclease VII small subunit [Nitrospiria bacterium]|nr:exodeoxyribonuclease VII small subunit [Nitrospiria bacterium]